MERKLVLYADVGRIAWRDPDCIHNAMAVMVVMFCRVSKETNLEKTKAMVCTSVFIQVQIGDDAYKQKVTG